MEARLKRRIKNYSSFNQAIILFKYNLILKQLHTACLVLVNITNQDLFVCFLNSLLPPAAGNVINA